MQVTLPTLFAALCFSMAAGAQCVDNVARTTADTDFIVDPAGWVVDRRSGLMWKRCVEGRSYDDDNNDCDGVGLTEGTWQDALNAVVSLNAGTGGENLGFDDWRMPSVKELISVLELGCGAPALNPFVFRSFGGGTFWSSTTTASSPDTVLAVQLGNGRTLAIPKAGNAPVLGGASPSLWVVRDESSNEAKRKPRFR